MPSTALTLEVSRAGPVDVVAAAGELDIASAGHLSATLLEHLGRTGSVVLDLHELSFVDSGGLHALLSARRRAQLLPADLVVARIPRRVDRLMDLTGSAPLFERFGSLESAVAELIRRVQRRGTPPAPRPQSS